MGSVVTSLPGIYDQTNAFGAKRKMPVYVQFVPGIVVSVITAQDSESYDGEDNKIGSIKALPHIGGKAIKKKSMVTEEGRYYPLMRGIQETPVSGDPVLLCTFGGRQYYLGPLNTEGNPNFNKDVFEMDNLQSKIEKGVDSNNRTTPPLFIQEKRARLQKPLNKKLDNPGMDEDVFVSNAIHGDLILEGRHGNSLRIGSRNTNPHIVISNGRAINNPMETTLDGTIFSIFKRGSIRDHFNHEPDKNKIKNNSNIDVIAKQATVNPENNYDGYEFTLADEEARLEDTEVEQDVSRSITKSYNKFLGRGGIEQKETSFDVNDAIYNYKKDQLFASSGRITLNARTDSIFLSAYNHIHIGCGSSMSFSTNRNILIESAESVITNTPLFHVNASGAVFIDGRRTEIDGQKVPAVSLGNPLEGDSMHKAVLGDGLVTALTNVIDEIKNLAYATSQAIEGRKSVGGSVKIMDKIVKSLDDILGQQMVEDDEREESYQYPKTLSNLILSDSVEIKK